MNLAIQIIIIVVLVADTRTNNSSFSDGALLGIHSMKVSTDYINPRASCESTGVIIFYCGPANDEDKMLKIGRNLLEHISYENNWLYYKSDQQTAQGTRATGLYQFIKFHVSVELFRNPGQSSL